MSFSSALVLSIHLRRRRRRRTAICVRMDDGKVSEVRLAGRKQEMDWRENKRKCSISNEEEELDEQRARDG